ncbi:CD209 antigen-like protein E [Xyrichtys novacula]|uniref:CD209 antigen-like protein E n=1 Tax=Xyrichtys novacula TaxID=13765 RepID=A0AAV1H301_XYRNO|nr:CD209 antigen-like protein E [Xyrichtys novacula]
MEEIYVNVEMKDKTVTPVDCIHQTGPRSSKRRFHEAAIWFLGLLSLLLLAGVIALGVYCYISTRDSSAEFSTVIANLTERLSSLTEQRDLLNVSLSEVSKELQSLKKQCPPGWTVFGCSCYFFSTQKKSWDDSRADCRDKGADLVIIESFTEQEFLTNNKKGDTWIGLSDRDDEGTWKWIDDTPLTQGFWWREQPDNGGGFPQNGEEDCAHLRADRSKADNWNDRRCDVTMLWICEK